MSLFHSAKCVTCNPLLKDGHQLLCTYPCVKIVSLCSGSNGSRMLCRQAPSCIISIRCPYDASTILCCATAAQNEGTQQLTMVAVNSIAVCQSMGHTFSGVSSSHQDNWFVFYADKWCHIIYKYVLTQAVTRRLVLSDQATLILICQSTVWTFNYSCAIFTAIDNIVSALP